jgi:hypothetical protein
MRSLLPQCGDCTPFVERALRAYEPLLTRYGFELVDCSSAHGGQECLLMYRGKHASLLFLRSDGAEGTAIGDPDAGFPQYGWTGVDGEDGWYSLVGVVEFLEKKDLKVDKLMREVWRGKVDYYAWEATQANAAVDRLLSLFAPGNPRTWQDDFAKYARTRTYG